MKLNKIFAGLVLVGSLIACEKEYESEALPNHEMSGQWYVRTYVGDTSLLALDYVEIVTSNTAATDGSELLIDDHENIWPFKVKVISNPSDLSFEGANVENLYWPEYDTIQQNATVSGKIYPNKGHSLTGIVVDSIYIEAEFSDDPGTTYIFAGHYRTGFEEDEP
ncbi:MAG TPA: hypothetical protein DIU20_00690 [Cryomorphaceae bacterium]|nr:hypothetical protein [Cryomorphaceae bacterium]